MWGLASFRTACPLVGSDPWFELENGFSCKVGGSVVYAAEAECKSLKISKHEEEGMHLPLQTEPRLIKTING